MVGAFVALRRQLHHCGGLAWRSGVVRTAAPVAVGQCGGATLAVGGQHPASVALGHAQQLSGFSDGDLYSKAELSTESLACSFWFNVTYFMGRTFSLTS